MSSSEFKKALLTSILIFLFIDYSQNIKLGNMNFGMNTYVRIKKICAKNCISVILLLVEIDKKKLNIFFPFLAK